MNEIKSECPFCEKEGWITDDIYSADKLRQFLEVHDGWPPNGYCVFCRLHGEWMFDDTTEKLKMFVSGPHYFT